jgi:hypothetical protein
MATGTILLAKPCYIQVHTINNSICRIDMNGVVEPDIGFNPGNDWNGISVKVSAMLTDVSKVGTNWANIH